MAVVGRWRATYAPGDWLVLCGPSSLVVTEPPGSGWTPLAAELWLEVLGSASLVELAGRLARYGLDTMPSFGALFWSPDGMRSIVRGSVRLVDPGTDRVVASGEGVQTWAEVGLAGLVRVRIETGTQTDDKARDDEASEHEDLKDADVLRLPLVIGAVRASSIVLDASPDAVSHSPQPDGLTDDEPEPDQPGPDQPRVFEEPATTEAMSAEELDLGTSRTEPEATVSLTDLENADTRMVTLPPLPPPPAPDSQAPAAQAPAATASSAPTVLAVVCPHGHPSPPDSSRCIDCGVRITDRAPRPVPQPALATLRVTDGTQAVLDRVVLVGRAPSERGSSEVRLLTVPSPAHDISRTHLEIVPDGWRVLVKDLNSTNGTVLLLPDGVSRRPLPPGEAVPVPLASVLELAEGVSVLLDLPQ
jgi:hypothetical protein